MLYENSKLPHSVKRQRNHFAIISTFRGLVTTTFICCANNRRDSTVAYHANHLPFFSVSQLKMAELCINVLSCQKPAWPKGKMELLIWLFSMAMMMAACLSIIYIHPFITVEPKPNVTTHLNETLATTYDVETHEYGTFCPLVWVKVIFFLGFAASHFTFGFWAQKFGNLNVLKWSVKATVFFAISSTLAYNIYIFYFIWFLVGYFSTASYLLTASPVLENVAEKNSDWKWRLVIGVFFQMSWTLSRLISNLVVAISSSWITVVLTLVAFACLTFFSLEKLAWKEEFLIQSEQEPPLQFFPTLKNNKFMQLNMVVLSLVWFTLGYNYYGMMNSWKIISMNKNIFEHNVLASILAMLSKICALLLCYMVKRKIMPLMVLQMMTAICYFVLASVDFEQFEHPYGTGFILLVHLSTFLITASFGLIWVITPETFPQQHRYELNSKMEI